MTWKKNPERFEEGRMDGRKGAVVLRLSARRLAVVNTFSLVSLQMNTAIEATYNINVARASRSHPEFHPLEGLAHTYSLRCLHTEWPY